ncbi:SRPBCC domain-containing protein, partial [Candidatus Saccharibacteria bacterium]|nr:SRPBCC domain-containing protein [Candidatus Saccharibacteria bacterium]
MGQVDVNKDLENKKLVITYVASGPVEKVWKAYSDQAWFEKWWGPEGWETTTKEFNFAAGGRVHYGMKCVDERQGEWFGQTSWGLMEIESVEDGHSFTYRDYFSDENATKNTD